jgi:hypothetical protein
LETALNDLEVNLNAVIDEQDYMKMRERAHRNSKKNSLSSSFTKKKLPFSYLFYIL